METEEVISGFCKKQNQTRTVFCEFEETFGGRRRLVSSDCSYGACEHSRDCLLMRQALELTGEADAPADGKKT